MTTKMRRIVYGGIIAAVAVLLVLGTLFDQTISNAIYQPEHFVAKLFESVGIFPPFIFLSATFVVLFFLVEEEDRRRVWKKALFAAIAVLPYVVYGFMASETFVEKTWVRILVGVGASAILTPLTFLVLKGRTREALKRLEVFLVFASIVCVLSSLLTINVMKYVWGRVRYREMMAAEDYALQDFTPWYHINGFSLHGHHSFPSGHTCSATNLLVLCALEKVYPDAAKKNVTIRLAVGMYIFLMAYSRIVIGAHFLSDVTVGFLIGFLCYAAARYVYFDKSKAVMTAIMAIDHEEVSSEETVAGGDEGTLPVLEREEIEIPRSEETTEDFVLATKVIDAEGESTGEGKEE